MRNLFKIILTLFLVLLAFSLYANFLHEVLFFKREALKNNDLSNALKGTTVEFRSGQYLLRGKIITNAPKNKRVPLIIFCVGSGGQSSHASNYAKFLDSLFEQNLPLDSIALFYFDKRGVGNSEGKWYNTDFEERASDVKSAADFAKTLSFVDTSKIAVAGHSQGGWIAQICVSKYPETFKAGLSLAGATFDVKRQLINDYTSEFICSKKLSSDEALIKAKRKADRDFLLVTLFPLKQEWKQLKLLMKFKPEEYLIGIKSPFLFMFGENDRLVYAEWCKENLMKLFNGTLPKNIDTLTIKRATHNFKIAELCYKGPPNSTVYSAGIKTAILDWTRNNLLQ